ncbi:MAG: DNA photolyase [Methylomonas sp.]|jgi:spore photoproduct lyase|uniref:SPL family radical SAM protein n=1 Tax=Methylomonas sp. TaxID=418 RepID=UPI0025DCE49D|nr:DNA photolyase [Methylomonas sp.]MCK9609062.1 DNA photolyase [Methylomonas sp.]
MIDTLYIESAIAEHPRITAIRQRFPEARVINCERYGEVFNPNAQNFRLQKQKPALIMARKHQKFVLPAPAGYGIGGQRNYYFSHMLNCLYDCRYCFLQGMYQSANYVLFVNYEDFQQQIRDICQESPEEAIYFFSGYDCDSLAFEPVTGFAQAFLPVFAELPNAWLELRTKSTQIRGLLNRPVLPRCVVAFSLSPDPIANKVEAKAPSLAKRIEAAAKLQKQGWRIGLRFDPLIYQHNYQDQYRHLFRQVFSAIDADALHSASLGVFRLPEHFFKKMHKLYPEERLFASPLQSSSGMVSYKSALEQAMMKDCSEMLLQYIPRERFFPCHP